MGETVSLVGLDDQCSWLRRGVMARIRKGEKEYTVGGWLRISTSIDGLRCVDIRAYLRYVKATNLSTLV